MSTREALAALIERFAPNEGPHDTCCGPRVGLYRVSQPSEPTYAVHEPAFCVLAQGRKRVLVGDAVHHYDDRNFFLASVDVPVVGQVIEASPEAPYLSFRITLDPNMISEMIMETGMAARLDVSAPLVGGMSAGAMTPELFDAACRMIRLMETPEHAPVLAQLIEREILYRLLTGDQGPRLAQIARADGRLRQVNRAIGWIKRNFSQPFSIEDVAAEARMSASALHQHFKAVTALSPLQYQKQLRLQEARRLILVQHFDCATAGHTVGYDSPSQFSREYARLFGAPPLRDAARLREQPDMMVGA
jgi:AraC-like DNA-binding protein